MNAIVVDKLTKKYGNYTAVDNLSFQVRKGEVFGLLGENGAGKSTTIECILGTKTADSGRAAIFGSDPKKDRKKTVSEDRRTVSAVRLSARNKSIRAV